jgi:hypothetical protein
MKEQDIFLDDDILSFDLQIKHLGGKIRKANTWEGILHQLKEIPGGIRSMIFGKDFNFNKYSCNFSAFSPFSMAAEIRHRQTNGELADFPMFFFFSYPEMEKYHIDTPRSHRLFDISFERKADGKPVDSKNVIKMNDIVEGYQTLKKYLNPSTEIKIDSIADIFGLGTQLEGDFSFRPEPEWFIDEFSGFFIWNFKRNSAGGNVSRTALFILHEILNNEINLIDESALAEWLGIDIKKSGDWEILKEKFFSYPEYKGVFRKVCPCWWKTPLQKIWEEFIIPNVMNERGTVDRKEIEMLRYPNKIKAAEKVQILMENTKLKHLTPLND